MGKKEESKGGEGGSTSAGVYILDKEYAWVPANLIEQTGDKAKVNVPVYEDEAKILTDGGKGAKSWREETVSLKNYPGKALPLQNIKNGTLNEKEDMVDLPFLHEAAILYNIKARHIKALPYTRTGDIVIAVNPYQWLTDLYTEKQQLKYADRLVWNPDGADPRASISPHVYETSALCYRGLAGDGMDQSILVSGESGAGKTETVKICMNHIATVQAGPQTKGSAPDDSNVVVQRVVESNPLLEAFGNAKTRRNDNSSRFGKYIQLQFDRDESAPVGQRIPACRLAGSKCEVYLLEKIRVTTHDETERTYHIFYQMLAAKESDKAEIWPHLKGKGMKDFKFVGHTDFNTYDGHSDDEHYYKTVKALASVGVKGEKLMTLMRAIAIVLQLGNITFGPKNGDSESSAVTSRAEFDALTEIMGCNAKDLELALTERTMVTRGETFKVPLKADFAKDSSEALAKEIYEKLFIWLVREINAATCAEDNYTGKRKSDFGVIGLLDIFGFESFPVNGFEQLCINYANEKLQQKFTKDIFQAVLEEYKFEGIKLDDIKYDDNSDVLNLIEGRTGLLAMLNEECVRPKGNDKEFVFKAKNANKDTSCLIQDRLLGPMDFGIHHYAGKVVYFADGFVTRNQDTLALDLKEIAKKSSNDIVANHLDNNKMMWNEQEAAPKATMKRGKSGIASDTLWTKFKNQLNSLMSNLSQTNSRYIRCLKPNTVKKPLVMFNMTTIEQLRCAGVVAAVTISRSAFPNRLDHRACLERFKVLYKTKGKKSKRDKQEPKDEVQAMLDKAFEGMPPDKEGKPPFVVGKTRVYFRMGSLEHLENLRMQGFDVWAVDIQRIVRGWLITRHFKKKIMRSRGHLLVPIQCWWRCILAKKELKKRKKVKKSAGKKKKKQFKAAVKIQAHVRTFVWRPKFKAMLKEHREKMGLQSKVKELEKKAFEAEQARQKEVAEAREQAEAEMEAFRTKMKKELANDKETQKKAAQQQTLIDESGKIIEFLRKENTKLRNQNDTMRKDFKALKENNQRLMEANASAGASFTALNDHAKQLNATNGKLIKSVEAYKAQLEKLKDDLKMRQAYYLAEAEARLAYQKTMAQIVSSIQDKCRDPQLIEDVVIMALECEAEAKAERSALDSANKKKQQTATQSRAPSLAKTDVSADSDSDSDSDSD